MAYQPRRLTAWSNLRIVTSKAFGMKIDRHGQAKILTQFEFSCFFAKVYKLTAIMLCLESVSTAVVASMKSA
jgi:hypothetical protein